MNDEIIAFENIKLIYRTKFQVINLFDQLNLTFNKNEYVVILGKSGSGKSSILNLIAGILLPTEGQIIVDNQMISRFEKGQLSEYRNKKIGYIFQSFNLIFQFTVLENVMVPLLIHGMSRREAKEKAYGLLSKVELENRMNHFPNELSGGEQQRVSIARALANDPDIILADEPTGNLDVDTGKNILDLLDEIHKQGKTILLVTHDEDIIQRATKVIRMKELV